MVKVIRIVALCIAASSTTALPVHASSFSGARGPSPVVCKGTVCRAVASGVPTRLTVRGDQSGISCPSVRVTDGDTLRCGSLRLRLLGIDAPEIEACPRWRVCVAGDGQASKRSLTAALQYGVVHYKPMTHDRFGRQVAVVWAGSVNLSCWQLQQGQAVYKAGWDNGAIIERACR